MQPFSQPQPHSQTRQPLGIPAALVACVAQDDVLICIEKGTMIGSKRQIFEHRLSERNGGYRCLTKSSTRLCSVERSVDGTTTAALRLDEGQLTLILCTMKGEILKYTRLH